MDIDLDSILSGEILPIFKPKDWTSFDVVNKLKWTLKPFNKKIKVGHAGTLDPLADGLLLVCTGSKTKTISELQEMPKTYIADIYIGATRPSYDRETEVDETYDTNHIDRDAIVDALADFVGEREQIPPAFSAIKQKGKPVYLKARNGENVEMKPRKYIGYKMNLMRDSLPIIQVEMEVSKGTYIRTIAHDLGKKLKSGAYLEELTRTAIGPYSIDTSWQIEDLVNKIKEEQPL